MSSTNRGSERHAADYYVTPVREIEKFLHAWAEDFCGTTENFCFDKILDPCAGGDANTSMSYPDALARVRVAGEVTTVDIREDSPAEVKADFLEWDGDGNFYDLIITNPPFNIAQDIITKSLDMGAEYVVMLLRLNYFGSGKRKKFWQENMPEKVYVHADRMNFVERLTLEECRALGMKNKGTDSIEYGHFVWRVGYSPKFTQLRVI